MEPKVALRLNSQPDSQPGGKQISFSRAHFDDAVAAFACWIPARRASSVDPNICLKYE